MIFPGMDPYLENRAIWPVFHNPLIVYLAELLRPALRPRYTTMVENRLWIEGPERYVEPDIVIKRATSPAAPREGMTQTETMDAPTLVRASAHEVIEWFLTIRDRTADQKVIAVVEVVSPTNKYAGPGRDSYVKKQKEVLASDAHLIEIDLLRAGPHVVAVPETLAVEQGPYDYLVCVNRARGDRRDFELYPRTVRQPLPRVRLPLSEDDPDAPMDLQAAVRATYERGDYDLTIDYAKPCVPPLSTDDQAWADGLLRAAGKLADPPG